jgi:DNA uptake protein ComE-like DNA-binding protein
MQTHLRLTCLLSLLGLGACAMGGPAPAGGAGGGGGKADDAADDAACVARGGEYDGVALTRREAELVLDLANKASMDVLDYATGAGLDADTARSIFGARSETGSICNLSELAALPQVGPANLERARQFSAVWELAESGEASVDDLMREGGTYDGTSFTAGEAFIALEMASYASVSQLDAIPHFRSDAARELVRERRARGGFSSLAEVAEVFGVGSRHMALLRDGMADWRVFARAAQQQCGSLDAPNAAPERLTDVCPGLAIEGETLAGDLEGISFTQEEAALTLDFVNTAELRTLDAILDTRAARAIAGERDRDHICDLTRLGNVYYVGPAGLKKLRRFTATWEAYQRGEGTLAELAAPANERLDGVSPMNNHELRLVLDMANTATEEQLDAIEGFRSDAARNVAAAQRGGFRSLADLDAVAQVGPAHIGLLADAVNEWRRFLREAEERPACSAFARDPGLDEPPATEPILDAREAEKVRQSLDDICGDTWCEGDYNWYVTEVSCPGDGTCYVSQRAQQYGGFSEDVLAGRSPESLQSRGEGEYGTYHASIDSADGGEDGTWLMVSCELDSGFFTREDAMNVERGRYSEKLYYSLLDCISALEEMMWAL